MNEGFLDKSAKCLYNQQLRYELISNNPRVKPGTDPDTCMRHNGGGNIIYADGHVKWSKHCAMDGNKAWFDRTSP